MNEHIPHTSAATPGLDTINAVVNHELDTINANCEVQNDPAKRRLEFLAASQVVRGDGPANVQDGINSPRGAVIFSFEL